MKVLTPQLINMSQMYGVLPHCPFMPPKYGAGTATQCTSQWDPQRLLLASQLVMHQTRSDLVGEQVSDTGSYLMT
jgi:hypothetical protein